jgi:hypothetical protein
MSRWIPLVLVGACCPPEPAKKVTVSTVQQPSAKPELRELAVDGEVRLKNLASSACSVSIAFTVWTSTRRGASIWAAISS